MGGCGARISRLSTLDTVLQAAQERGFIGPADVKDHMAHAAAFAAAVPEPPTRAVDLGTGGGVPGLVLAELWPEAEVLLVDADAKRTGFLDEAVVRLGWVSRVRVLHARAEDVGRAEDTRRSFDVVSARSFGSPAVTAECGAPLLRVGGLLVVSDPPSGGEARWPVEGLATLGLEIVSHRSKPVHLTVMRQTTPCSERFPRRPGTQRKRPLF